MRCPTGPAVSQQLLIASDLHFNPFADPTLVAELASAPVRKWEAILNRSQLHRLQSLRSRHQLVAPAVCLRRHA